METYRAALWSSNLDNESRTNKGQSSGSSSTYYSRFPILILLLNSCSLSGPRRSHSVTAGNWYVLAIWSACRCYASDVKRGQTFEAEAEDNFPSL